MNEKKPKKDFYKIQLYGMLILFGLYLIIIFSLFLFVSGEGRIFIPFFMIGGLLTLIIIGIISLILAYILTKY